MSVPTFDPWAPQRNLDDYDRTAELVRRELGGGALPTLGKHRATDTGIGERKAALVREVSRSIHIRSTTESYRIADAAYPYLLQDHQCTDEAVTAACGPLYSRLTGYRPSAQHQLRAKAHSILTRAIDATSAR
jgi:hypothetical protein